MHYIYKITDTLSGKIYIGQSNKENERWRQHKYFARQDEPLQYIHRAMKKYGVENFVYEIIDFAFNKWQADCLEENYIQQFDTRNKEYGYNIAPGGNVAWQSGLPPESYPMYGKHHTEESKRKISESNMGKIVPPHTEEWKQEMSKKLRGVPKSKEWKEKRSRNNHHMAKLNTEIVAKIREEYATNQITLKELATKYGVHFSTIHNIISNKTWIIS